MMANQARRFGETLVDRHVLSRDALEQAIEESERKKQEKGSLGGVSDPVAAHAVPVSRSKWGTLQPIT